jgi:hypothetical protein
MAPVRGRSRTCEVSAAPGTRSPEHVRLGEERVGRDADRSCSVLVTVTGREEVRPMNAVSTWVLPLFVTAGRST